MISREHREFLATEIGRKWFIEKTLEATPKEKNWQSFHTPYDLCEKMISKTTLEGKNILVLFNVEFLEVLIHKFGVSNTNITFLADCRIESELAAKVYKVNNTIVNNIKDIQEAIKNMGKQFDLCFSNPPYTGNTDMDIIQAILPICTEIIVVHPAAWLLDNKFLERSYFYKYRKAIENCSEYAYIFDGNKAFNIIGPCSLFTIFKINKNHKDKITVDYFENRYEVDTIWDVTTFGSEWKIYVVPFINRVKTKNNLWDTSYRIKKKSLTPRDKYYFQCRSLLPGTAGNDVWDCLIQLNSDNERYKVTYDQIEDENSNSRLKYYFNTEIEVDNFINYLKTDFVRFGINIYKTNQHFDRGELRLAPWLDFTQEWTDEKLYKFFNIPQETIDYITNFFPDDIYGLRNKS